MIGVAQKTVLAYLAAGLRFGFGTVALHAGLLLDGAEVAYEFSRVMAFEGRCVIRIRIHDMTFQAGLASAAKKIDVDSVRKMRVGWRSGLAEFPIHGQTFRSSLARSGAYGMTFRASAGAPGSA